VLAVRRRSSKHVTVLIGHAKEFIVNTAADPDAQIALLHDLLRAERRAAVSRVASVIAHLIGTPLNVISGRAALIRHGNTDPAAILDNAARIEQQVDELAQRLRRLIQFLTPHATSHQPRAVSSIIAELGELYEPIARAREVQLSIEVDLAPETFGSQTLLEVLASLMSLAVSEAPVQAKVILRATDRPTDGAVSAIGDTPKAEILLSIPQFTPPSQRQVDRLDPPEEADPRSAEHLQVLAVCAATARQNSASLHVEPSAASVCNIRLRWPIVPTK
jgi:signal transduction histidine kinase